MLEKWPKRIIWLWEFKPGTNNPCQAFKETMQALAAELAGWDQLYITPKQALTYIDDLSPTDAELVRAASRAPGLKWVEMNDIFRGVCLWSLGGLLLDGGDTRIFPNKGEALDLCRTIPFFITNGNSDAQFCEPDIVGAPAKDETVLLALKNMCNNVLHRRDFARGSGALWSICNAWDDACRERNITPCAVVDRFLIDTSKVWHQTSKSKDPIFSVHHANSWCSTRGLPKANIPPLKTFNIPFDTILKQAACSGRAVKRPAQPEESSLTKQRIATVTPLRALEKGLNTLPSVERAAMMSSTTLAFDFTTMPDKLLKLDLAKPIRTQLQLTKALKANHGLRTIIARILMTRLDADTRRSLLRKASSGGPRRLVADAMYHAGGKWTRSFVDFLSIGPIGSAGGKGKAKAFSI